MAKNNIYELVTNQIISELENNVIPWQKPWRGVMTGAFNRVSKRPYSLLNQMLLKHRGEYATFKQWSALGGHIKKGEKSEMVVFWKLMPIKKKEKTEEEPEDKKSEEKEKSGFYPVLKSFRVFHISQVEGVEPLPIGELKENEPIELADKVLHNYVNREEIRFESVESNRAFYNYAVDRICIPLLNQFDCAEEYYSTAFHEATHSTMLPKRCDRREEGVRVVFGSDDYSKEELVAEIGSATLLNMMGIDTEKSFHNSVAYIKSWLEVLKNDPKFIVSASSKAEKAVKFIIDKGYFNKKPMSERENILASLLQKGEQIHAFLYEPFPGCTPIEGRVIHMEGNEINDDLCETKQRLLAIDADPYETIGINSWDIGEISDVAATEMKGEIPEVTDAEIKSEQRLAA